MAFWLGFWLGGLAGLGVSTRAADNFRYPWLYVVACSFSYAFLVGVSAHYFVKFLF